MIRRSKTTVTVEELEFNPLSDPAHRSQHNRSSSNLTVADLDSLLKTVRSVEALLNKLTTDNFDSVSNQVVAWANKSEGESDARTLILVCKLVFEKSTDGVAWTELGARLCRKIMEQISSRVRDDAIRDAEGNHITGGHLFRKYLLNRLQEDFERGRSDEGSVAYPAVPKSTAENIDEEASPSSGNPYAIERGRHQGPGLAKFIGELFKLRMLTERIVHECVKGLLRNVEEPEEDEIESLCMLLTTTGALLDTPKARTHIDVYFSRMKELARGQNVTSQMRTMLQVKTLMTRYYIGQ